MFKNLVYILVLIFAYLLLPRFLPWWSVALAALVFGYLANSRLSAFFISSGLLALVWGVWAQMQNAANEGLLAGKMGVLLGGMGAFQLVLVTAALGALIGGLFGTLGYSLKRLLKTT